jgi:hypothetical protein
MDEVWRSWSHRFLWPARGEMASRQVEVQVAVAMEENQKNF